MFPHLPTSTLFPYTTLFRSDGHGVRSLCESNVLPADGLLQKGRWRILNSLVRHRPWSALFYYQEFCTSASFNESRSEEHTSELQSRGHLVCRLLLEKKKNNR